MAIKIGSKAPIFTLFDADKKSRSLSEFLGKNVILAFFPARLQEYVQRTLYVS